MSPFPVTDQRLRPFRNSAIPTSSLQEMPEAAEDLAGGPAHRRVIGALHDPRRWTTHPRAVTPLDAVRLQRISDGSMILVDLCDRSGRLQRDHLQSARTPNRCLAPTRPRTPTGATLTDHRRVSRRCQHSLHGDFRSRYASFALSESQTPVVKQSAPVVKPRCISTAAAVEMQRKLTRHAWLL